MYRDVITPQIDLKGFVLHFWALNKVEKSNSAKSHDMIRYDTNILNFKKELHMSIAKEIYLILKHGDDEKKALAKEVLRDNIKRDVVDKYYISGAYEVHKHTFDDDSYLFETTYNVFLPHDKNIHLTPHETTCLIESVENEVQDLRAMYTLQCSTLLPLFVVMIEKKEKELPLKESDIKTLRLQALSIYEEIIKMRNEEVIHD